MYIYRFITFQVHIAPFSETAFQDPTRSIERTAYGVGAHHMKGTNARLHRLKPQNYKVDQWKIETKTHHTRKEHFGIKLTIFWDFFQGSFCSILRFPETQSRTFRQRSNISTLGMVFENSKLLFLKADIQWVRQNSSHYRTGSFAWGFDWETWQMKSAWEQFFYDNHIFCCWSPQTNQWDI